MDSPTHASEYSDLVRLSPNSTIPPGHAFISVSSPPSTQQLCRELTFARGRVLYEIWDPRNRTITGWVVPSPIAAVAWQYKHGITTTHWNDLPLHSRNVLNRAYGLLKERFPRMPEIAVIKVAERAEREKWDGEVVNLEQRVVNCVKHRWTSYESRREYSTEKDVLEMIEPRMREVLKSWFSEDMTFAELERFWWRHGLCDAADSSSVGEQLHAVALRDHGGLETLGNVVGRRVVFS